MQVHISTSAKAVPAAKPEICVALEKALNTKFEAVGNMKIWSAWPDCKTQLGVIDALSVIKRVLVENNVRAKPANAAGHFAFTVGKYQIVINLEDQHLDIDVR